MVLCDYVFLKVEKADKGMIHPYSKIKVIIIDLVFILFDMFE